MDIRNSVLRAFESLIHNTTLNATNLEKSVYNSAIQYSKYKSISPAWENEDFVYIYKTKAFLVKSMLTDEHILSKLKAKEIKCKDIAEYRNQVVESEDIEEGILECKKCGSKKTTFYSLQTRSADEPMTNFITCVDCKNRWKM